MKILLLLLVADFVGFNNFFSIFKINTMDKVQICNLLFDTILVLGSGVIGHQQSFVTNFVL